MNEEVEVQKKEVEEGRSAREQEMVESLLRMGLPDETGGCWL